MKEPFVVSPYEAAALGFCMGLSVPTTSKFAGSESFLAVVRRRLIPLFPVFGQRVSSARIQRSELPEDVQWFPDRPVESPPFFVGYSQRAPDTLYVDRDGELSAQRRRYDGHSFPQRLLGYLSDVLPDDPASLQLSGVIPGVMPMLEFFLAAVGKEGSPQHHRPPENQEAIAQRLEELMQYNECQSYFELGRDLGIVIANLSELERSIRFLCPGSVVEHANYFRWSELGEDAPDDPCYLPIDDSECQHWLRFVADCEKPVADMLPSVERLTANRLVGQVSHLSTKLKYLRSLGRIPALRDMILRWSADAEEFEVIVAVGANGFYDMATSMSFGFAQLLGIIRHVGDVAQLLDSQRTSPRTYRDYLDTTGTKVRVALEEAERGLSQVADAGSVSAAIVRDLWPAVEAICRRTWPADADVSGKHSYEMCHTLHWKLQSADALECRLAGIALTLITQFSEVARRELGECACGLEEARFFVQAVRTLLDLSSRLEM